MELLYLLPLYTNTKTDSVSYNNWITNQTTRPLSDSQQTQTGSFLFGINPQ
jgi:hypothetical protein